MRGTVGEKIPSPLSLARFPPAHRPHYLLFCRRCSDIVLEVREEGGEGKNVHLGSFGMLHPDVLKAYELRDPSSAVEMDLEPLM